MATFLGTSASETIDPTYVSPSVVTHPANSFPSDDADSIDAAGGDDLVWARGGNDTIAAGSDDDQVDGGTGDDVIYLGAGNDNASDFGYRGDDYPPNAGNDTIFGETGNDTLNGGRGTTRWTAEAGLTG